jgi:hypothetical protein
VVLLLKLGKQGREFCPNLPESASTARHVPASYVVEKAMRKLKPVSGLESGIERGRFRTKKRRAKE